MPRASNGTYTAPSNSWNPAVTNTVINPTDWNAVIVDLEAAITDSLDRSGLGPMLADLNVGGFNVTGVGNVIITGASSGNTTLKASATASGTLTLPAVTDTLVGATSAATLTNKSIATSQLTGTLATAQGPAFVGDVTSTASTFNLTIAANAVTNAKAAQMASYTIKGNVTNATANATDWTIDGLTAKASPVAGDEIIIWDVSGAAIKKATVAGIQSGGIGVGSIAGNTGAFTLTAGVTNNVNAIQTDGSFSFRNRIINPSGKIAQIAPGSTANGTYTGFDQWYALTQTAAVTASALTNVENGTPYMMRLTQAQVAAQRFGLAQMLELADCVDLRGQAIVLSARVRCSASTTLHYAIIEWTGTADTPTKNVVNDWTSGTYTTGNFFIATTTTITATSSTALTANTLATISLTGTVGSSANNISVFFWTESTQAQNVTLDIGKVQLEIGLAPTVFGSRPITEELHRCQRFYAKTFAQATSPAQNTGIYVGAIAISVNAAITSGILSANWQFPATMRTTPTITTYSPGGLTNQWWSATNSTTRGVSILSNTSDSIVGIEAVNPIGSERIYIHATADARF